MLQHRLSTNKSSYEAKQGHHKTILVNDKYMNRLTGPHSTNSSDKTRRIEAIATKAHKK